MAKQPMVSYSQNGEDIVLSRVFSGQETGFYVDVGANDPLADSVTKAFYDRGWRGLNLEPGRIFDKLAAARPLDLNLNIAASDASGELAFREYTVGHGLSSLESLSPTVPEDVLGESITHLVPVRTLRDIFAEIDPPSIDFMSVDVEGHERKVLLGNDWSRWRPRVLVIEATLPASPVPCHELWEDVVLAAGYRFAYFDRLNRFYVREEDQALLPSFYPPCVFDNYVLSRVCQLRDQVEELHSRVVEEVNESCRLREELGQIHRGLGGRTLAFGLGMARLLHSVTSFPGWLLGKKKAS